MPKAKKTPWVDNVVDIFDGMAQVHTTRNSGGNYYIRMRVKGEKKYLHQSLKTRDKETAIARAKKKVLEVNRHIQDGTPIFGMTLRELANEYLDERRDEIGLDGGITEGRWNTIKTYVNSFLRFKHPTLKLAELDQDSCYDYYAWRNKERPGISYITIRNEQALINHLWGYAFRKRYVNFESFRFKKLKAPIDSDTARRGSFTPEEWKRIYKFMRDWVNEKKDTDQRLYLERALVRDCMLIGANTMLRVGELWQLKWKDIRDGGERETDTGKKVRLAIITVRGETSKVRKTRKFESRGLQYFKRLKSRTKFKGRDDYVFSQIDQAKRFRRESFYAYWVEIMKGAKIKDYKDRNLTWYSLRHFAITTRLRAEIDVMTLAEIAGTSVEQIRKHYGHIDRAMRERAILKDPKDVTVGFDEMELD